MARCSYSDIGLGLAILLENSTEIHSLKHYVYPRFELEFLVTDIDRPHIIIMYIEGGKE